MIYTGNNGRIYLARSRASGLQGTFTVNIPVGLGVYQSLEYVVRTISGGGKNATVRCNQQINPNEASRQTTFTVVNGGGGYLAGDVIRFMQVINSIDVTNNITVSTVRTRGVDNQREILDDKYRIAKVRNWSLTSNSEVVETTSLGDSTKTFSPSVTSAEGSATLMFYEDDASNIGINRQKDTFELIDLLFPRGTPPLVIMNLAIDGSTDGTVGQVGGNAQWKTSFLFNAFITSASVGVNYGEVVTIDTSFTVDGPFLDAPSRPGVVRL